MSVGLDECGGRCLHSMPVLTKTWAVLGAVSQALLTLALSSCTLETAGSVARQARMTLPDELARTVRLKRASWKIGRA